MIYHIHETDAAAGRAYWDAVAAGVTLGNAMERTYILPGDSPHRHLTACETDYLYGVDERSIVYDYRLIGPVSITEWRLLMTTPERRL